MTNDIKKLSDGLYLKLYEDYANSVLDYNYALDESITLKNNLAKYKQDQASKALKHSKSLSSCVVYYGAAATLLLLNSLVAEDSTQVATIIACVLISIFGLSELRQCYKINIEKKEEERRVEQVEELLSICTSRVSSLSEICMNKMTQYKEHTNGKHESVSDIAD